MNTLKKWCGYSVVFLFFFGSIGCKQQHSNSSTTVQESNPVSLSVLDTSEAVSPVFHTSHELKKQNAPFSDVVEVGNLFFLSGQIGMDHNTREVVEGGIVAETTQALENIKSVLAHHNLQMEDVVKATVILADIDEFSDVNTIYTNYFPKKPARTTFAASGLARNARIEIDVIAVKR